MVTKTPAPWELFQQLDKEYEPWKNYQGDDDFRLASEIESHKARSTFQELTPGSADEIEIFYEKMMHNQNMSGWKGIVFVCYFDSSDKVLEEICQRAETDIELLAAISKIELRIADANNAGQAVYMAGALDYVTLQYNLSATKRETNYETKAVYAELAFTEFYSVAVERHKDSDSIDNMPRTGDLVLWSNDIIGFGPPYTIIGGFSDGAETLIKKALTLYITHNE